jgi:IS5 family transposase
VSFVKNTEEMQGKITHEPQLDLFKVPLSQIVSPKLPIVDLTHQIKWDQIEKEFGKYYSENGRPSVPTRTMVGLLLLKSMFSVSDEALIPSWVQNPYWQYFCGEQYFRDTPPCDPSDLVHFRNRIGKEGTEFLLKQSVLIHGEEAKEDSIIIDTTVQEKDVTFPTDAKLYQDVMKQCWAIARNHNIQLHQSFRFLLKQQRLIVRFMNHPKKRKSAVRAIRKIKGYARKLLKEVKRKLPPEVLISLQERVNLFEKVLHQKRSDKNKIYSLHEPHIYCLAKGKEHKKYEFGCKASIALTRQSGIVVAATTFETSMHDAYTLEQTLKQVLYTTGRLPGEAICDRGYRGKTKIEKTIISIPKPLAKTASKMEILKVKAKFRRRAAIEPIISHLKFDHRMLRNHLKGIQGDFINCVLAGAGFNLKKMLRKIASSLTQWLNPCFLYLFAFKKMAL